MAPTSCPLNRSRSPTSPGPHAGRAPAPRDPIAECGGGHSAAHSPGTVVELGAVISYLQDSDLATASRQWQRTRWSSMHRPSMGEAHSLSNMCQDSSVRPSGAPFAHRKSECHPCPKRQGTWSATIANGSEASTWPRIVSISRLSGSEPTTFSRNCVVVWRWNVPAAPCSSGFGCGMHLTVSRVYPTSCLTMKSESTSASATTSSLPLSSFSTCSLRQSGRGVQHNGPESKPPSYQSPACPSPGGSKVPH